MRLFIRNSALVSAMVMLLAALQLPGQATSVPTETIADEWATMKVDALHAGGPAAETDVLNTSTTTTKSKRPKKSRTVKKSKRAKKSKKLKIKTSWSKTPKKKKRRHKTVAIAA